MTGQAVTVALAEEATAGSLGRDAAGFDFDPHRSMSELGRSAVRGGAASLGTQAGKVAVQAITITMMARLLDPTDFGLIAIALAVTGFLELFKDLGLSMATVQRPTITHDEISALFRLNAAAGLALTLVGVAVAPLIGRCYGDTRLSAVLMVSSTGLAFGGLSVQHLALLRRRMRFGTLGVIELTSQVAGLATGVGIVVSGGEYWGLVAMPVVASGTLTIGSWMVMSWRPSLRPGGADIRPLMSYGADLAGCSVLSYLSKTLDNVLIGYFLGGSELGLYSRAYALLQIPITQIHGPIVAVAIPVLSRVRHDRVAFSAYYRKFLRVLLALTTPICFATWLYAPEMVLVLLGRRWASAAPMLRELANASLSLPVWYSCGWLFVASGRTRVYLRLWLFLCPCLVVAFLVGIPHGALGVARAYSVAMWILSVVVFTVAVRGSGLEVVPLIRVFFAPLAACLAGTLIILGLEQFLGLTWPAARLVLGSVVLMASGGLSYGLTRERLSSPTNPR